MIEYHTIRAKYRKYANDRLETRKGGDVPNLSPEGEHRSEQWICTAPAIPGPPHETLGRKAIWTLSLSFLAARRDTFNRNFIVRNSFPKGFSINYELNIQQKREWARLRGIQWLQMLSTRFSGPSITEHGNNNFGLMTTKRICSSVLVSYRLQWSRYFLLANVRCVWHTPYM